MLKIIQASTTIVTLAVQKCRWTSFLETAKYTCTISAAAVTNSHTLQTGGITGITVTIGVQETTGTTETINKTGKIREITEVTQPARKISP